MNKTWKIKIIDSVTTTVIRKRNYDVQYSGEETSESHDIQGFKLVENKGYQDIELDFDPLIKGIFLVYVSYDTGDSFSRHEGKICFVDAFENSEDAHAVAKAIVENKEKRDKDEFEPVSVFLPVENKTIKICVSTWKGYFERFNYVEVMHLKEQDSNRYY